VLGLPRLPGRDPDVTQGRGGLVRGATADRAGLAQSVCVDWGQGRPGTGCVCGMGTGAAWHRVCVQPGNRAGLAQGVCVCVCGLGTGPAWHRVCLQPGDRAGLAQGVCAGWGQGRPGTGCVCGMGTGPAWHRVCVRFGDRSGLVQGCEQGGTPAPRVLCFPRDDACVPCGR